MTREALKKLNEKQMNYCKTLSALIDRAKIKGLKEENERNRGKLRCKDGRNHRKGSIYHCGSESRTGCKRWLGTLEEWRRLD